MYSGGKFEIVYYPVKFYFPYYPNYLAIFRIFWKFRELCEFFKQFAQFAQLHPVSTRFHIPRIQDALLKPLIAAYSHEKRLYGSLYHNQRKPLKIAFKRVTSLCPFYRTQNLSHITSIASCRCAFCAVYLPHLQAMVITLVYSYTNGINTLKRENTRLLWNS